MRAHDRTHAIEGGLIFLLVSRKGRVHRFFEGGRPGGNFDDLRAQDFHLEDIRGLLSDID